MQWARRPRCPPGTCLPRLPSRRGWARPDPVRGQLTSTVTVTVTGLPWSPDLPRWTPCSPSSLSRPPSCRGRPTPCPGLHPPSLTRPPGCPPPASLTTDWPASLLSPPDQRSAPTSPSAPTRCPPNCRPGRAGRPPLPGEVSVRNVDITLSPCISLVNTVSTTVQCNV